MRIKKQGIVHLFPNLTICVIVLVIVSLSSSPLSGQGCKSPESNTDTNDNSCTYPPQMYDLLKWDEAFDGDILETKFVYIKVLGNATCGNVLLEPKSGNNCFYDERVPGPQCIEGCNDTQTCDIVEIGTWSTCTGLTSCPGTLSSYDIGGNTIVFHGYESSGNESYWYYEITTRKQKAISHLTFGLICPNGSIGDYVWHDLNSNGVQDGGEPGINGVTVRLYDGNDNLLSTMVTMKNPNDDKLDGYYMFTDLLAGDYYLTFEYPLGYNLSPQDAGGDDEMDSDIAAEGTPQMAETGMITLESSEDDVTIDGGLTGLPILPVTFGDFNVSKARNGIKLNWTTLSEINNAGFHIERATNNIDDFTSIAFVEGKGNSNSITSYSFTDLRLGRSKTISYRLRQQDFDGKESFSAIRTISSNPNNDYEVFPNPTKGIVTMVLPETQSNKQIRIFNTLGKLIYEVELNKERSYHQVDLRGLEEGVYLIHLEQDFESKVKKVILNY